MSKGTSDDPAPFVNLCDDPKTLPMLVAPGTSIFFVTLALLTGIADFITIVSLPLVT